MDSEELSVDEANPYPFGFDIQRTALILIDFQRDFLMKGSFGEAGGYDVSLLQKAVKPTKNVLSIIRNLNQNNINIKIPIIHTKLCHKPDLSDLFYSKSIRGNPSKGNRIGDISPDPLLGRMLICGEYGNDFIDELTPKQDELIISKHGFGAFYSTNLDKYLKENNILYLIICGVTTEICVETTIREANDRGYSCLLLSDCTASYNPQSKKNTLEVIPSLNALIGWISNSKQFINSIQCNKYIKTNIVSKL